jgi:hypothetical protein
MSVVVKEEERLEMRDRKLRVQNMMIVINNLIVGGVDVVASVGFGALVYDELTYGDSKTSPK